jgi:hypothetical protein
MEGIELFGYVLGAFLILAALVWVGVPIVLFIIWIKRVGKNKSKPFGPLGIITLILSAFAAFTFPFWVFMFTGAFTFF